MEAAVHYDERHFCLLAKLDGEESLPHEFTRATFLRYIARDSGALMASTLMLAPNPNRSMAVDRVLIVGRSEDGSTLQVLSVDGVQSSEWAKKQFTRYFVGSATWNLLALIALIAGVVAAFLWRWWGFVPGIVLAGWCGFRGKIKVSNAAFRIIQDHPWALERFVQDGLVWETPASKVVQA